MTYTSYLKGGIEFYVLPETETKYILVDIKSKRHDDIETQELVDGVELSYLPRHLFNHETRMLLVHVFKKLKFLKKYYEQKLAYPDAPDEDIAKQCTVILECNDDEVEVFISAKHGQVEMRYNNETKQKEIIYI